MTNSDQIPGPRGYPLLGVLPKFWRDPLGFLSDTVREYGDLVCLRRNRLYLANHPDHVQHVLRDKRENYRKNSRRIPAKSEATQSTQQRNGPGEKEQPR